MDIDAQTNAGVTPLMLACKKHNETGIEALLENGANPLIMDKLGMTARNYLLGRPEN